MTEQPRDDDFDALIAEGIQDVERERPAGGADGDPGAPAAGREQERQDDIRQLGLDEPLEVLDEQDADEQDTDAQDADEQDADEPDPDEPVRLTVTLDSGPAFEIDDATWAAAVSPYQPVEVPGVARSAEEPPAQGWSLSSDVGEVPTVQMDALELREELRAASLTPVPEAAQAPVPAEPPAEPDALEHTVAIETVPAAMPEPLAEPEPEPEPAPVVEPQPAPVPEPAVAPQPVVAPQPEAAPEPAAEPTPAPAAEPGPEPAPEPAAEPVPTPASAPVFRPAPTPAAETGSDDPFALAAIERVRGWVARPTPGKRDKAEERLAGLLQDPNGLDFAVGFVDRVVRPEDPKVGARNFEELSRDIPGFLDWYLKLGVTLGGGFGIVSPKLVIPMVKKAMREMVSHLVIDATPAKLAKPLAKLREDGTRLDIDLLGEAVLGEEEAASRLAALTELLQRDDVDAVSVSVSSMAPQPQPWAFDETVEKVSDRLLPLYALAAQSHPPKLITLEMGEYRDLDLTIAVFERLLTRPELARLEAGIVLQAYLPDALAAYRRLAAFAKERRAHGGAGITVRLVKGAHLAMERVDAALHGWPLATLPSKESSDANFKRVLREALLPDNAFAVRVGVASHNLFDLAYAAELAREHGTHQRIDAEMLLGMAADHRAAVREVFPRLVLSTPVVLPDRFDTTVGYLIRRLEEHAAGEGFMSSMFELADPVVFQRERDRFLASLELLRAEDAARGDGRPPRPNRTQDRLGDLQASMTHPTGFANEPDTDPALAANRDWARQIVQRAGATELGARTLEMNRIEDWPTLERRIDRAAQASDGWAALGAEARSRILRDAAAALGAYRGRLIEIMMAETGKTIAEADPEVSEAIDLARLAAEQALTLEQIEDATPQPVALTVVVPHWSVPVAVPVGGATAALATGSAVMLTPPPQARRSAAVLCEALWEAGVPREVLVLCDVAEGPVSQQLIAHPAVGRVILTGSSETAARFTSWRPELPLLAETGGKNAIVVTPSADLELAAADIVRSAFGHAGQKRDAASVVIMVGTVGDSERFRRQLVDATRSLRIGSPLDARTHVGPLIEPAQGALLRALTTLEPGEEWLLEPKRLDAAGRIWSPGIRDAVEPGSFTHVTELFGPHLSLIEVETLDEAIDVQNASELGLAAGLHSLDPIEVAQWLDEVRAGTLYVNRGITGAIVRRQPLGGWRRSQVGPGARPGGPSALHSLVDWQPVERGPRESVRLHGLDKRVSELIESATPALDFLAFDRVRAGANSDQRAWEEEFGEARDVAQLGVERNVLRYRPADVLLRVAEDGSVADLVRLIAAAARTRAIVRISTAIEVPSGIVKLSKQPIPHVRIEEIVEESDAAFHARIASGEVLAEVENEDALGLTRTTEPLRRIRLIGTDAGLRPALAGNTTVAVYDGPVTTAGRIELLPFLREQTVSITAHRFGTPDKEMQALTP
ncbi:bifunctional proline dehydrogenase/L-glutamate gamma-semialdehyde dehydrogenase [Agrococcus baldri]|uniref:1-pyrroline-5-carboxylate dehydrogenase n=1 Tax=Agrococcus baldri TaxID=153730 RepID=A0AA87RIJ1_9MICO|nr:bifunctional proline dehydrogenase/L-glutamate gamma-semialdehyde dehydrogenase [Agrococcus baldri]GEK80905.1 1-pyrroline-5-carboxylate dehydrogenase [Agrococcus baldri]